MTPEEAMAWLDSKGIRYELCDTPVPVLANKANCGVPLGSGDQMVEDYYYLPKSMVGLRPLMEIHAQGDSMVDADIHEGDLLQTEIGALPQGTIANAFSDNPVFNENVGEWDGFHPLPRIIKLRDELRKQLKL